jgi:hypothetical protein
MYETAQKIPALKTERGALKYSGITYLLQQSEPPHSFCAQQASSQLQLPVLQLPQLQSSHLQLVHSHCALLAFTAASLWYAYALAKPITHENIRAAEPARIIFFISIVFLISLNKSSPGILSLRCLLGYLTHRNRRAQQIGNIIAVQRLMPYAIFYGSVKFNGLFRQGNTRYRYGHRSAERALAVKRVTLVVAIAATFAFFATRFFVGFFGAAAHYFTLLLLNRQQAGLQQQPGKDDHDYGGQNAHTQIYCSRWQ